MEFRVHPFNSLERYFCVDILALYNGQWVFCMHKERDTWESPGGHIDQGETPLEAAKRELYEETGAIDFDIEPLCDYYVCGTITNRYFKGNGQVYFAIVHTLDQLPPGSEIKLIDFFDSFPDKLTYPMLRDYFPMALEKKNQKGV